MRLGQGPVARACCATTIGLSIALLGAVGTPALAKKDKIEFSGGPSDFDPGPNFGNAGGAEQKGPLSIAEMGSFMVGGESVEVNEGDLGNGRPAGHFTIHQMYVEYMIPQGKKKIPVVMMHGGVLSGKSLESTPDGRMGWEEYFVRKGHPVYNADQVSRGRSGFDPRPFNLVRTGQLPPESLPNITQAPGEFTWPTFRFGPSLGEAFPDTQFPVEAADQWFAQSIPDLNSILPTPNPTYKALSDLAKQLDGAVVMGHSESGTFPFDAALTDPAGTKGLIDIESGGCKSSVYTDDEIDTLATVPILVVFGDHLDAPVPDGRDTYWMDSFNDCRALIDRVNAAGGNAKMFHPPNLGIFGNSHMIMLDKNNLQIADIIMEWIDQNVN